METAFEKVGTAIASAGLVASAIVHTLALFEAPAPPALVVYALFAGAGISQVLGLAVAPRPTGPAPWTRKQLRDAVLDAAPFEMRAGFYALLSYAFVQFAWLVVSFEPDARAPLLTSTPGLRFFSCSWLVLYFSALTACAAARRTRLTNAVR